MLACGLAALLFPWPLQIGEAQVTSTDLAAVFFGVVIALLALQNPVFKVPPRVLAVVGLIVAWQLWLVAAWVVHPYDKGPSQLVWHIFKNGLFMLPLPIVACLVAYGSPRLQRAFYRVILGVSVLAASLGIIQTISGGRVLSGLLTNQRFLGFLTPLPSNLYDTFIRDLNVARLTGGDGYFVGSIFRAHGPFLHPNPYASMVGAAACLALGFWLTSTTPREYRARLAALVVMVLGVVASLGITGLAALACVAVYALLLRSRPILSMLLKPAVVLALSCILLAGTIWVLVDPTGLLEALPAPVAQPALPAGAARSIQRLQRPLRVVEPDRRARA